MSLCSRFLVLVGPHYNHLARCATAPTLSTAAHALFPASNLFDRKTEQECRFAAAGADDFVNIDKNMMPNGNMEGNSGGELLSWVDASTSGGNVTYNATGGVSSGPGMQLAAGASGIATAYQDIDCAPGERLNVVARLKSNGTDALKVRVQNRRTGKFLTSGAAWQTASADVFTETAATFQDKSLSFVVESLAACRWQASVPLRFFVVADTASLTGFADDFYVWPSTSAVTIHGHDLEPTLAVEILRSATPFGSGTSEALPTVYRPTFAHVTADGVIRDERFWRVRFNGTPFTAQYLGELVLGQYKQLQSAMSIGWTEDRLRDQVRVGLGLGAEQVRLLSDDERRTLSAEYRDDTVAAWEEFDQEVMKRSAYGAHPWVMIPDDKRLDFVLHCRLPKAYGTRADVYTARRRSLEVVEDPFPTFVA